MNPISARLARVAALSTVLGWAWMTPPAALAQLGSLIVTITSPTSGSVVHDTIPVDASVTVVGSLTVARVDFYVGGSLIGSDSSGPSYSIVWNTRTVGNGSRTVTAIARNSMGAGLGSDSVTVTVSNDTTPPSVTINQAASQADPASSAPILFTAIFSEAVNGFTSGDVAVGGTAGGTKTVSVSGGPSSYTVAVSGMTSSGTVTATIPAGAARDGAGNNNTASTSSDNTVTFNAPDGTPPTVDITSPASGETVSGTIIVTASASDNVGVTRVEFLVDGIALGTDTTAPYEVSWNTTTAAHNSSPSLTAQARDAAGNTTMSAPVTVTVSNVVPPALQSGTRFEETDLAITYTPGWFHYDVGRPFSGGTATVAPKAELRATFAFTGTSVRWIGFRGPQAGIALVFIDGNLVAQVDTYAPAEETRAVMFSAADLPDGSHVLWIEATGLKNPVSSGSIVVVDAFDVAPASPPQTFTSGKRVEETGASVAYTSGWTQGDRTTAWSGGTAATARTSGAQATFTFTGTSVNWIGFRGPSAGIANVYVDGAFTAAVDLYEPFELQAVTFSASGLANTSHTIAVRATGQRNAASTDSLVVVDAFDTRQRFEETRSNLAYTETWEVTTSREWSDKTAVFTWVTGAHATFTFTGTSVRWISYRGSLGGIARVFLDGTLVAQVDTYSGEDIGQNILYEARGLAAGSHALMIEATGEKNPLAQQAYIAIDAFDINF